MEKIFILLSFIVAFNLNSGTSSPITLKSQTNNQNLNSYLSRVIQIENLNRVQELIKAGADVNGRNQDGDTPLHLAAIHTSTDIARVLLDAGAKVNSRGMNNNTPLHWAAYLGNIAVARLLIDRGADVNARNSKDDTPLDFVESSDNLDVAQLLINRGAIY